ncbi:hypothetical protein ANOM_005682 [Aspergillus nomiae NRRL 13137]|uniref:Cyanovirin-N domain-containing protein n=1 Tax=Aspergillus nomiae NRRL (strain ATCC 15546 / NRRL 13137 / CBS 260.88 / M93) TaxID=1509407 RepID=A0A0L1J4J6_ASPN3|nr:uncharacterized protein ANOM_005682 [Aspergillus nomiae NRRL 13137]KNG86664.1 hypothetical protein ANOM_005682 [Aspergillus nomiae NRRL 13137]
MKLLTVAFSLLLLGQVNASPLVLDKRTSCQVGGIDKIGAADAACSASVVNLTIKQWRGSNRSSLEICRGCTLEARCFELQSNNNLHNCSNGMNSGSSIQVDTLIFRNLLPSAPVLKRNNASTHSAYAI